MVLLYRFLLYGLKRSEDNMKKKRKCAIFFWIFMAALVLGLSVPISLDQLHNIEVHVQAADDTDGVYTIEGRLWHATMDQPSMGNSAVTQPMKIVKSGDKTMLQMEFHSLRSGVFSGYLYSLHYFPSWHHENQVPEGAEAVSVTVTEYYNGIYDDYNRSSNGLDEAIRGKFYPHYAVMPIEWNADSTWVQVYVPVMEAVSAGSGRQYARLLLDWNTLKKTEEKVEDISLSPAEPSSGNATTPVATAAPDKTTTSSSKGSTGKKKLKIGSLQDGTYTITGEMVKSDKKTKSMANEAINHSIILTVKKGKYSLTMSLSGLTVGSAKGYLSQLKYFKSGYKKDKNGVPPGKKASVTIKSYQ
ncbi:MAG: NEAT domain-containing protein [Lachnospiraceae bacterium]|nr:NEAT domain-containing protein [Lachnospiraceae bacterium]